MYGDDVRLAEQGVFIDLSDLGKILRAAFVAQYLSA